MASRVDIANRARLKLAQGVITDISEDEAINASFDIIRDDELRAHNWRFAYTRVQLPALSTDPLFGYGKQYELPTDCLRVVSVTDKFPPPSLTDYRTEDESDYTIEDGKILTDLTAPLNVLYIRRVTVTGEFDASFVEVLANRLAMELAEIYTQSNTKADRMAQMYERSVERAIRSGAVELAPEPIADDTWVLSRL